MVGFELSIERLYIECSRTVLQFSPLLRILTDNYRMYCSTVVEHSTYNPTVEDCNPPLGETLPVVEFEPSTVRLYVECSRTVLQFSPLLRILTDNYCMYCSTVVEHSTYNHTVEDWNPTTGRDSPGGGIRTFDRKIIC